MSGAPEAHEVGGGESGSGGSEGGAKGGAGAHERGGGDEGGSGSDSKKKVAGMYGSSGSRAQGFTYRSRAATQLALGGAQALAFRKKQ